METRFFSNETKKYVLLFPLAILIGAVVVNAFGMDKINEWGLFNAKMALNAKEIDYSFIDILKYIFEKRILHFIIIFLVCFSTLRDKLFLFVIGWLGTTFGIILGALYMQYNITGLLVFIVCVMTHFIVYLSAVTGLIYIGSDSHKKISGGGYIICISIFCIGIVVESLINWAVFPFIMGRIA